MKLTPAKRETLEAIVAFKRKHPRNLPTAWDVGRDLGITEGGAGARLRGLHEVGLLRYGRTRSSLHLTSASTHDLTDAGYAKLRGDA